MAYQNTGFARNTTLTITKGDTTLPPYSILAAFTDPSNSAEFEALTTQDFQRLTEAEYQLRLQAFIRHVYFDVDGLQDDCPDLTRGSVIYDPDHCPVPVQEQTAE